MSIAPRPPIPFRDAEEAWFWTMSHLGARQEPARCLQPAGPPRPCTVEQVLRCLDQLYRLRRIQTVHIRILRIWGERRRPPDASVPRERCDARLWREAMDRLEARLALRGHVVPRHPPPPPAFVRFGWVQPMRL